MADETYPDDLLYHPEHDWARVEGDEATLGITWFAADALGELVHFEAPEVGSLEPDAMVCRSRLERQGDLVTGMKTDSGAGDGSAEGALRVHDLSDGKPVSRFGFPHLSKASAIVPIFVILPLTV